MKVLMYVTDEGGLKSYAEFLVKAMKKQGFDATLSNKTNYNDFDVFHVIFDHSLFHPFGLGIIPKLIRLKLNKKKIVLTFGTIPNKKEIYTRNKFFTLIKKIILPISTKLVVFFSDKIVALIYGMKKTLVVDYKIDKKKIKIIEIGHGIN
ncbi:MAG: hypothetical protein ABIH49_03250 [archaeon]